MRLQLDRLDVLMQPNTHQIRPHERQRQQRHQTSDPLAITKMCRLEIKPPRLQRPEERLDLPALSVKQQGLAGLTRRHHDDKLIFRGGGLGQAFAHHIESVSINQARFLQTTALAHLEALEALPGRWRPALVADLGILLDADDKVQLLRQEVAKPPFSNEFAVGQNRLDPMGRDHLQEPIHQRYAFVGRGVALLVKQHPDHGDGDAFVGDGDHQNVDLGLAKEPLRAIDGDGEGVLLRNQRHDQAGDDFEVHVETGEEATQTALVRCGFGVGVEHQGELAEVDRAQFDQRQNGGGSADQAGAVPSKVGLQSVDQSVNLHGEAGLGDELVMVGHRKTNSS